MFFVTFEFRFLFNDFFFCTSLQKTEKLFEGSGNQALEEVHYHFN